jgi:hypothetical protein
MKKCRIGIIMKRSHSERYMKGELSLAKIPSGSKTGLMNELRVWLCSTFRLEKGVR